MDQLNTELNDMLIAVYHNILRMEELTLKQSGTLDLTINEMHLIESVGKGMPEGRTIRELAEELNVKSPSVTVAVKKLEAKGYVQKAACENDGRSVRVRLTRAGKRVDAYHSYYHRMMMKRLAGGMTDDERQVLIDGMKKLNDYFLESIGEVK